VTFGIYSHALYTTEGLEYAGGRILCTMEGEYFIWQLAPFFIPILSRDGRHSSDHRYSNVPWIGFRAFYFSALQTILRLHSTRLKKVPATSSFTSQTRITQSGAPNVIPLIVHITHFYYYKSIWHLVQNQSS